MKGGAGGTEKGGTAGGGESAGDDVRVKDERTAWDNMMEGRGGRARQKRRGERDRKLEGEGGDRRRKADDELVLITE